MLNRSEREDSAPEVAGEPRRNQLSRPYVRLSLEMALALMGAELTRSLPMPWRVAGVVFAALAVVQGLRAIRELRAYRKRHPSEAALGGSGRVLIGIGVGLGAGLLALQVVMLAMTPLVSQYESCQQRALTITAEQGCSSILTDRLGG